MKNYIDEIIKFNQFIDDCPKLATNAKFAKEYLKGFYGSTNEEDFIVIEVEGYKCVAVLTDDFAPYTVEEHTPYRDLKQLSISKNIKGVNECE